MEKQNVTEKLEFVYNKVLKLENASAANNQKIQDLQHNEKIFKITIENLAKTVPTTVAQALKEATKSIFEELGKLIEEDLARIARLERYVEAEMARRKTFKF